MSAPGFTPGYGPGCRVSVLEPAPGAGPLTTFSGRGFGGFRAFQGDARTAGGVIDAELGREGAERSENNLWRGIPGFEFLSFQIEKKEAKGTDSFR